MPNFQPENQKGWDRTGNHSSPFILIIVSALGILAWLIYILLFALYWSKGYNLFQDLVVFSATLCITGVMLGLMWIIWGRNKWHW